MKRILLLVVGVGLVVSSFAATTVVLPPAKASEIFITIGKNGEKVSLLDLSRMRVKDLQAITGTKMSFVDKVGFKAAQKKLRSTINDDGTIDRRMMKRMEKGMRDGDGGFHLGGFALGFFPGTDWRIDRLPVE